MANSRFPIQIKNLSVREDAASYWDDFCDGFVRGRKYEEHRVKRDDDEHFREVPKNYEKYGRLNCPSHAEGASYRGGVVAGKAVKDSRFCDGFTKGYVKQQQCKKEGYYCGDDFDNDDVDDDTKSFVRDLCPDVKGGSYREGYRKGQLATKDFK